jgi:urease accessory protein UreH
MRNKVKISSQTGQSILEECLTTYPFRIMQCETWNSYVSLSMVGFGGGMVAGDTIELDVEVAEQAAVQ